MTRLVFLIALLAAGFHSADASTDCVLSDNGTGTVDLPPNCPPDGYVGDLRLVEGLPPGDTIEMAARLTDLVGTQAPGGTLGGTVETFTGIIHLDVVGTGSLAGFARTLSIPIVGETHSEARTLGDPLQEFEIDVYRLTGTLTDDEDFWLLQFEGGSVYGLPSPGETSLTRLGGPGADFTVASHFEFNYRIQFEGNIESFFIAEYRGITLDLSSSYEICAPAVSVPDGNAELNGAIRVFPNPWRGVRPMRVEHLVAVGASEFTILDVGGRVVRRLRNAGGQASWDGRGIDGARSPAGVYFVRSIDAGGRVATARFVKMR